jgi:hypothetical protein
MPRRVRSDIETLLQEARAMEMLANEADVPIESMHEYWSLSADLITLVTDIEEYQGEHPFAEYDDPNVFTLKHRLRNVASRLGEMMAT